MSIWQDTHFVFSFQRSNEFDKSRSWLAGPFSSFKPVSQTSWGQISLDWSSLMSLNVSFSSRILEILGYPILWWWWYREPKGVSKNPCICQVQTLFLFPFCRQDLNKPDSWPSKRIFLFCSTKASKNAFPIITGLLICWNLSQREVDKNSHEVWSVSLAMDSNILCHTKKRIWFRNLKSRI